MPHSLYGYLSRQSTQVLEELLQSYLEAEETEVHAEIVRVISLVLEERKGSS